MADLRRPSSLRKRQAILSAAEQVFLRHGYLGASMDEVAVLSGVSKQTVYAHFTSKEALFVELVGSMTRGAGDPLHSEELPDPASVEELREVLVAALVRQVAGVLTPRVLQLRRLVIGEVGRFPELAEVLWENGPRRAISALAVFLTRMDDLRLLRVEDPVRSATFLNWLAMGDPVNRAMLLGDDVRPELPGIEEHCREAVRIFLAAHTGPDGLSSDGTG